MLANRVRMGSGKKSNLWANIQKIVRQGLANEHFSVGDHTPDSWWLRSPYMEASNSLYYVRSKGSSLYGKSSASFGLAPACVII